MTKTHLTDKKFSDFAIAPEVVAGLTENGFEYCTPIQAKCLPFICEGRDIAGQAQTGTGKTLAFLTATCHRLLQSSKASSKHPRALIMAPTRELYFAAILMDPMWSYSTMGSEILKSWLGMIMGISSPLTTMRTVST